MRKVGILTELNLFNTNYGNKVQAYALNKYINNTLNVDTDSIVFDNSMNRKITKEKFLVSCKLVVRYILKKLGKKKSKNKVFKNRLKESRRFIDNNIKLNSLKNSAYVSKYNYSHLIVGSDVVWAQCKKSVNRDKFLDIKGCESAKKISYAASFGINWIPEENKEYISSQLSKFNYISVRESDSISLLKSININNAKHVCDPTLLLDRKDWEELEIPVDNIDKDFIFVYLLGKNKEQRDAIKEYAKKNNLLVVTIPHANMEYDEVDNNFADIALNDCSPEQWIWLIDHANIVITDSFHGTVFSTIFKKKFVLLKREYVSDINIRMTDFLKLISEEDKFISVNELDNINSLEWDFNKIDQRLSNIINYSKEFIKKAILEE